MTSAGRLHEQVAFDRRQDTADGYGNTQSDFAERFRRRAGFTYLRGTEGVIAARLEGRQPIVVRLRADSDTRSIGTDWRMRRIATGEAYAVRSVAETPDRRWVDVMVEKGVAA